MDNHCGLGSAGLILSPGFKKKLGQDSNMFKPCPYTGQTTIDKKNRQDIPFYELTRDDI
jgi:hypothetical protein